MGISWHLNFEKCAGNAFLLNYPLHLLLKACIIWLQSIFCLLFSPYMYSAHLLKAKSSGQSYKSGSCQYNTRKHPYFWAVASQLMDFCCSGKIAILFPLPFKLFVAHTTKLYPTVQHKWTTIQRAGKKKKVLYSRWKFGINENVQSIRSRVKLPFIWGLGGPSMT